MLVSMINELLRAHDRSSITKYRKHAIEFEKRDYLEKGIFFELLTRECNSKIDPLNLMLQEVLVDVGI